MSDTERLTEYATLTPPLMALGWFVPPYIDGRENDKLKALVAGFNDLSTDQKKKDAEDKIHRALLDVAFSSQVRARYVWQALRTPNVSEYSHLYEMAVFAYYKREYAATICLLLTALEGILLSLNGWTVGQPNKPKFAQLKATIGNLTFGPTNDVLDAAFPLFRNALSQFVSNWLYQHTDGADFTLSVLNRHYVLHGLAAGNFYRPHDVHRLLLGFDLLIDVVAMTEGTYRVMVEKDQVVYDRRLAFYNEVRAASISVGLVAEGELKLLKEHPRYVAPVLEAAIELQR